MSDYKKLIVGFLLFLVVSIRLLSIYKNVEFHPDEISWFFHTGFFEQLFIKHDLNQTFWTSYESYDHPQISKYIFGGYLYLHDKDVFNKRRKLEDKWGRWNFYFNPEFGDIRTNGFAPYILKMREVNLVYTTGTILLLYAMLLTVTGNIYVACLIPVPLVFNTLFVTSMLRATSDAHMVFFVMSALTLMCAGFFRKKLYASILLGFSIGCAVSTKLTGAIILLIYGVYEYVSVFFLKRKILDVVKRFVIVIFVAGGVWYVSNPGLYDSPLLGTSEYILFRNLQSAKFERYFPDVALTNSGSRVRATFCMLVNPLCSAHAGGLTPNVYVNSLLLIIGFVALVIGGLRKTNGAWVVLMFVVGILTVNTAYLPLDTDRYYLLPVIAVYLTYGAGLGESWNIIGRIRKKATKNPT